MTSACKTILKRYTHSNFRKCIHKSPPLHPKKKRKKEQKNRNNMTPAWKTIFKSHVENSSKMFKYPPVRHATNRSPQDTWTIVIPDCPSKNLGTHKVPVAPLPPDVDVMAFLLDSQMIIRPFDVTPALMVLPEDTWTTSESCWGRGSSAGLLTPPPQWYTTCCGSGVLKVKELKLSGRSERIVLAELQETVR